MYLRDLDFRDRKELKKGLLLSSNKRFYYSYKDQKKLLKKKKLSKSELPKFVRFA
jgi:hypothetical protein